MQTALSAINAFIQFIGRTPYKDGPDILDFICWHCCEKVLSSFGCEGRCDEYVLLPDWNHKDLTTSNGNETQIVV